MDFESPDVEKDFPGLYASETMKKNQSRDSDYSDEEKISKKDLLIGKRRERKESKKDKGYIAFEGESSDNEMDETKSPGKSKKNRSTFKFPGKDKKEKRGCVKEREAKEKKEKKDGIEKEKNESSREEKKKKHVLRLRRNVPMKKCTDPDVSDEKPVFGVPLHEAIERSRGRDGIDIPVVVRECIDYIEEHGLACEGIYRISGVKSKVRNLKAQYNKSEKVYLYEHEPHIVASLLKQYLRDLPEPILTMKLATKFEEAASIKNEQKKVEMLAKLIDSLPSCNRLLLSWIFVHMNHVIRLEKRNKMNLQNVSIVLSPTMQISHRVLHALFSHSDVLFKGVEIKKYVPPIESDSTRLSLELPNSPAAIEEELGKQESLLNVIHAELNAGLRDKQKEEQLWEIQRVVTQLKRKLRFLKQVQDASKYDSRDHTTKTDLQVAADDFHVDTTLQKPTDICSDETDNVTCIPNDISTTLRSSETTIGNQTYSSISNESETILNKGEFHVPPVIPANTVEGGDGDCALLKHPEVLEMSDDELENENTFPVKNVSDIKDESIQNIPVVNEFDVISENTESPFMEEVKEDIIASNYDKMPAEHDGGSISLCSAETIDFADSPLPEKVDSQPCRPSQLDLKLELPVEICEFRENTSISAHDTSDQVSSKSTDQVSSKSTKVIKKLIEDNASVLFTDSKKVDVIQTVTPETEQEVTDVEDLSSLLREEQMLLLHQEELVMLGDELRRKITSERQEVDRLKLEIKEYQQLYKYKQYSFDSTENSSSESDNSDSDDEDYATILEELIKESFALEQKNKELIQHIQHERESRMDIKVQMKMLQLEMKPIKA